MIPLVLTVLLTLLSNPGSCSLPGVDEWTARYKFSSPRDGADFSSRSSGGASGEAHLPKIVKGKLVLLDPTPGLSTSVGFAAPAEGPVRHVEVSFDLILEKGCEGAGFAWLDVGRYGAGGGAPDLKRWEAPSLEAAFGVGFDASNPVDKDPFKGSGNFYGRPQHEFSLHWDGMEIKKRTTLTDFRDGKPHKVRIEKEFCVGGCEITVVLDKEMVFDRFFIPSMTAFRGRPALGGINGTGSGEIRIDNLTVSCREAIPEPEPPLTVIAIDKALNNAKCARNEALVAFPEKNDAYGRIVMTLFLDRPKKGFDPWDRIAHIFAYDDESKRVEVARYITPYHKGHLWKVDVTDLRPLFQGERKIEQFCGTQGAGWVVTVKFDFYRGPADLLAYKVINLWCGNPEIGNPDKPASDFYVQKKIKLEGRPVAAKVRMIVTGHGMSPNTKNAGEFMPLGRTLFIGKKEFRHVLWKTDNYLNPCRPQGGTWKYDRAGWAPGDVVGPWVVDATAAVKKRRTLTLRYVLDHYENTARGKTWAPTHRTESQLILFRKNRP